MVIHLDLPCQCPRLGSGPTAASTPAKGYATKYHYHHEIETCFVCLVGYLLL